MPIFEPGKIQQAVSAALKDADVGEARNAFVAVVTRDSAGQVVVKGVISRRVNDVWTVKGVVAIDHDARISGGVEVKAAW